MVGAYAFSFALPDHLTALPPTRHAGRMSDQDQPPCNACGGSGLTEHEQHTVETDENGNQKPVVHRFTGACGRCGGTGKS